MKKSPLDDLSFFKFPEVTPEVVRNIVLLFVVIALAVVATLFAQRFIYWRQQRSARFGGAPRRYGAGRLTGMTDPAGVAKGQHLAIETAVEDHARIA